MKLYIEGDKEEIYDNQDSWWDIVSSCKYKIISLFNDEPDSICIKNRGEEEKIDFDDIKIERILMFIKKQEEAKSNISDIYCSEFCDFVNWKSFNNYEKTKISINEVCNIKIWDNLLICNTDTKKNNFKIKDNIFIKKPFFHFAVYIWKKLFISKFWKWALYITTFEEMHKIYNYWNFYIIK
jgi:hypothetical protein